MAEVKSGGSNWGTGLGFLFLFGVMWAAGGYMAVWVWPESEWAYKWRYSLEEDMAGAVVSVASRPHDCEFLSAPIGRKNCHYNKSVSTIRIRKTDAPRRVVSYDEGKTWEQADPSVVAAAFVLWEKVED